MISRLSVIALAATAALVLGAHGAAAQYYPTVQVSPPAGKPYNIFQQDNAVCQQWANGQVAYTQQQANNNVGNNVVGGAIGGALIGGLLGGGRGAAIGAGAGAVTGGVAGSAQAQQTAYYGQQQFDGLYGQCMGQRGNIVRAYGAPPPPAYNPPAPPPNNNYNNNNNYNDDN